MKRLPQSRFAMLYSVLLVSLILTIAVAISNLTLSSAFNLAKDSGIAFYQADTAVECGMYEDSMLGKFPLGSTVSSVPQTIDCGTVQLALNAAASTLVSADKLISNTMLQVISEVRAVPFAYF